AAPSGVPEVGPLVCGTLNLVDGTAVWTDYVYDDHGPAASGSVGGGPSYPDGLSNAADLVQLQVAPGPSGLRLRAVLQTLNDPRVPILGVGFDTDANPATGAPAIPGGAWPAKGPLGLELFVSVHQGTATVSRWEAGHWLQVAALPARVDTASQVMET